MGTATSSRVRGSAVIVAAGAVAVASCGVTVREADDTTSPSDSVAATASTVADLVWEAEDLSGLSGARYPESTGSTLTTSEDAVWTISAVTSPTEPEGPLQPVLQRFDPVSGEITTVDTGPVGGVVDVEAGADWVWAVTGGEWLQRIDPDGVDIVETIDLEGGYELTATDDALWVVSNRGNSLTRVDPTTGALADPIPLDRTLSNYFEPSVAATDTAVWLTDLVYQEGVSVLRVDLATGRTDVVLAAPDEVPAAVVAAGAGVWVLFLGELIRLDPITGERVQAWPATTRALSEDHLAGVVGIVATDDGVWFGDADGNISLVDPASDEIVDTIEVGLPTSLRLLGATADALWLVDQDSDDGPTPYVLTRIDIV